MENLMKELHASGNEETRRKIESKYPELFPKGLEVGRWYRNIKALRFIEGFDNTKIKGYGFGLDGYWQDSDLKEVFHFSAIDDKDWQPATDEEVKSALIAEAKKRGIWNVPIIGVNGRETINGDYYYEACDGRELWSRYGQVFNRGKWATTITKKYTMAELESIVGHKFEII